MKRIGAVEEFTTISRRKLLTGSGALVLGFTMFPRLLSAQDVPSLPGSLEDNPMLDSWIRVNADGTVTVLTGKVELGQGVKTALTQIAAEELQVDPDRIELVTADTDLTPDEGYTAGSQSMSDSGTAILNAAAQVRGLLLELAAARLNAPVEQLGIANGTVEAPGAGSIGYGDLVGGRFLRYRATDRSPLRDPGQYTVIGQPMQRVDIPPKVTGGVAYVQDLRLPGMVHARPVRPPSYGARLRSLDAGDVEGMPGVLKVVRDGSYLGVIAEREEQAIDAMAALAEAARWDIEETLPDQAEIFGMLRRLPSDDTVIAQGQPIAETNGGRILEATFNRPYQMHASIGPSCAVGLYQDGFMTVWTHSQGVYPLRESIAEMLRIPETWVRCIHMEGAGCYGHNGADDAAADAALLARAMPGRPVRVQWMRQQENGWEPYGAAMTSHVRAVLGADGRVTDWNYEVWSNTHSTRPGGAGLLMPAWYLEVPFLPPPPRSLPQPTGGGDRNAIPLYTFPNTRVVKHFIPTMPLRVSALRALGAYANVFSLESFMDELAEAAGADPVEFRLRHLEDQRARDVIERTTERFGWSTEPLPEGRGRGLAFARYKNLAAYTAVAVEVEVNRESGEIRLIRAVGADDSGQAVNPDGIRNQIEGGIIQSASWTLNESVDFTNTEVTSVDWNSYPILRFPDLFETVDVEVIDRPGEPFLGTGESAQGPTVAAIANAVADAIGARVRELPLTPERVTRAIAQG